MMNVMNSPPVAEFETPEDLKLWEQAAAHRGIVEADAIVIAYQIRRKKFEQMLSERHMQRITRPVPGRGREEG